MQQDILFDSLKKFCSSLKGLGLSKVVCAEINERRPVQTDHNTIEVMVVKYLEVFSYHQSVIYKYIHDDSDFTAVYKCLYDNCFEIETVNRNIT